MAQKFSDPDGERLPIKVDSTSNGEYVPRPISQSAKFANQLGQEKATLHANRRGVDRRNFMMSSCGVASTLLAFNAAHAMNGKTGGYYDLPSDAAVDLDLASHHMDKKEFIFDVQGHFVNPTGKWLDGKPATSMPLSGIPKAQCDLKDEPGERSYLNCLSSDEFIKDIFLDSDTDMMVLSFVPSRRDAEPLTIEEASEVRDIIDKMEGNGRLLLHGRVNPNQDGDLDDMDELAEKWGISAWKTYTQWGPDGKGYYLDDPAGVAMIEKARALGVKVICIHKGFPFGRQSYEHSRCDDIGRVAKMFPDVTFIVYHSGFDIGVSEGAFAEGEGRNGVDSFVQSMLDNEVGQNSNVYAELGSTWRVLMQDPDQAAHVLGKLINAVGEDNVLWGTDSIWYGSPQDQIQAFRAFQISEAFQEAHGYPKLTDELKAKIFGKNATKPYKISIEEVTQKAAVDPISHMRKQYAEAPNPHFQTHGPKNRREFLNLLAWNGGSRL